MDVDPHQFRSQIETLDYGRMAYAILPIPDDIARNLDLSNNPRLRVTGRITVYLFEGACQPNGRGGWYLILSKSFRNRAGIAVGDTVTVQLAVADQDAVHIPPELRQLLDEDEAAGEIWDRLTPGKKRGLAYRVGAAKKSETRLRRAIAVLAELEDANDF